MIYGLKWVIKYLLGRDIAGRALAVYPDDTFIVSYPRSGNTWTRFLVANLLHPEELVSFANIERVVPDCEATASRHLKRIPRPRVIKSHEYFDHRYPRVVYIVRDPRDVALSYYDFERKYRHIEDSYPLEKYVCDFVKGNLSSKDWGTWGENVGSWISTRMGQESFLLLRYEDMVEDAALAVRKLAAFFGIRADEMRIASVVERSSAQRMRQFEREQADRWVSTKGKRSDIPFIRSAVSGNWRSKLSAGSIAQIEFAWGPLMGTLGYKLVSAESKSGSHLPASADASPVLTRGPN